MFPRGFWEGVVLISPELIFFGGGLLKKTTHTHTNIHTHKSCSSNHREDMSKPGDRKATGLTFFATGRESLGTWSKPYRRPIQTSGNLFRRDSAW